MPLLNPSYIADEDVAPSVFVKRDLVDDNTVTLAVNGTYPICGVTHNGSCRAPLPGVTPLAAKAGEGVMVHGEGDTCEVRVGVADLGAGVAVTANSAGGAVLASTGYIGGYTLALGKATGLVKIQVLPQQLN
jgi:hypothetical protein